MLKLNGRNKNTSNGGSPFGEFSGASNTLRWRMLFLNLHVKRIKANVYRDNGKIHTKKKISKLFSYDGVAKCCRILKRCGPYSVLQPYTGKNNGV